MNDDFCPAVRKDRLRRRGEIVDQPVQRPDALYGTREPRRGCVFHVLHGDATLARVSHSFKQPIEPPARVFRGGVGDEAPDGARRRVDDSGRSGIKRALDSGAAEGRCDNDWSSWLDGRNMGG
jgi:hypothetical protein